MCPRFLWMSIRYPGATPQEVEQQIARPLEETLRTVKGIERIRTYSGTWGLGAPLSFRQDADMELAYNQVMDRLERLKPQLPEEARDNTFVWKRNEEGDAEIMWIGVAIDSSIADPYRFLETHVQRPLERIDGVAKVDFWGVNEREVMVEVDQERLRARGVNTYELVQALRSDNFAIAGGHVHEDGKRFYVRSVAKYRTLEEIRNIPMRGRNGQVRLKEVADVVYGVSPTRRGYQRIDGRMAASLEVKQESGGNIVAICDRVVEALERIEAQPATAGLAFNVFFNQGKFIRQSIRNLQNTALWGGFFAAMVLLFFLRAVRMTAIITLAIPMCVMITMTVLYFVDWSLNMVTMMGLMVGVGMVVDNAIVILENIYRMREKGEAPRQASIRGASEVALAITMATLTTVVVFLPLMLMGPQRVDGVYVVQGRDAGNHYAGRIAVCGPALYPAGRRAVWRASGQAGPEVDRVGPEGVRPGAGVDAEAPEGHPADRAGGVRHHPVSVRQAQADGLGAGKQQRHPHPDLSARAFLHAGNLRCVDGDGGVSGHQTGGLRHPDHTALVQTDLRAVHHLFGGGPGRGVVVCGLQGCAGEAGLSG